MQNLIKMLEIALDLNARLETLASHILLNSSTQRSINPSLSGVHCSIVMRNIQEVLNFLFSAFITTATRMICTIIRVHLVSVIIVVCSVRRVVGIHLIRVVVELTTRVRIPGNTMSFCHVNTPLII